MDSQDVGHDLYTDISEKPEHSLLQQGSLVTYTRCGNSIKWMLGVYCEFGRIKINDRKTSMTCYLVKMVVCSSC